MGIAPLHQFTLRAHWPLSGRLLLSHSAQDAIFQSVMLIFLSFFFSCGGYIAIATYFMALALQNVKASTLMHIELSEALPISTGHTNIHGWWLTIVSQSVTAKNYVSWDQQVIPKSLWPLWTKWNFIQPLTGRPGGFRTTCRPWHETDSNLKKINK